MIGYGAASMARIYVVAHRIAREKDGNVAREKVVLGRFITLRQNGGIIDGYERFLGSAVQCTTGNTYYDYERYPRPPGLRVNPLTWFSTGITSIDDHIKTLIQKQSNTSLCPDYFALYGKSVGKAFIKTLMQKQSKTLCVDTLNFAGQSSCTHYFVRYTSLGKEYKIMTSEPLELAAIRLASDSRLPYTYFVPLMGITLSMVSYITS
jgi:hypothetical protein